MVKHVFTYVKPLCCACLLFFIAEANAEVTEPVEADSLTQDKEIKETEAVTAPVDNTREIEGYNITRRENPDDPCDRGLDTYNYEKSWYDKSQIYINSRFCEPALWFDNFFANDRIFQEGAAGTYIRWRNDFILDQEESYSYKMGISASVELPGVEKHLRLTFEGDQDEDLRDIAPGTTENANNSLGLQVDLVENVRSKFNVSISISPKVRLRYRYTYPVYEDMILRLTQELQRDKAVNSGRTLIDFEKAFKQKYLFRASTEGKLSEEFDGVNWLQAFVLYQRVDKKTSISYETSVTGVTQPRDLATDYRAGVRFRKNFHRSWLFYEIAPEMTWPITLDQTGLEIVKPRRSKWLLFFRLEIHFGNAHKKRYQDYN